MSHLNPGDDAPRFTVTDVKGTPVRLEDFAGKHIFLTFHRFAACPLCNLRTDQIVQYAQLWQQRGLVILAFYHSTVASIERFITNRNPPYSVIADPDRAVYDPYGVRSSTLRALAGTGPWHPKAIRAMSKGYFPSFTGVDGDTSLLPADFLITPDLKIHKAHYARSSADHLDVRVISQFAHEADQAQASAGV